MNAMDATVNKLCIASQKELHNPYAIEWPSAIPELDWYMSPEFVSLYGTELYEELDQNAQKMLSFFECVNFFSLNINGERALIEGIARRLYRKKHTSVSKYLHHFLDEENKHMVLFGTFCTRYAGKVYPDRKLNFDREYAPGEEDFLFFAKVMIFEEISDAYNLRIGIDERVQSLARQINLLHHKDEARHLVFGRQLVADLFAESAPGWSTETLQGIRAYLASYIRATFMEYYNPSAYADAGFPDPYAVYEYAVAHKKTAAHRKSLSKSVVSFLMAQGILTQEPQL